MDRSEGTKTASGLLQLPLASHAVLAPCLVPRDRDVNEPPKELALARLCVTPRLLERLVGGEVLPSLDQLEAADVRRLDAPLHLTPTVARTGAYSKAW